MKWTKSFLSFMGLALMGLAVSALPANADLVGHWDFEDGGDLTAAQIGSALVLTGADAAVAGSGGPDTGATQVGVGSHYTLTHGIAPNGGGTKVNQYSLLFDVSYPASSAGSWMTFFSTDTDVNANDGEYFIHPADESWGVGDLGYTDGAAGSFFSSADTWYRAVLTVDVGNAISLYIDGVQINGHNPNALDGRFALNPTLHLMGDENGDDATINVSNFAIFDSVLSSNEVAALGGAGRIIIPEPSAFILGLIGLAGMASVRRSR